jgi:hypothetical protein
MRHSGLAMPTGTTVPRPTRTPLTSFSPEGPTVVPPAPQFTKDPDHGWIYGHHPLASPDCQEQFKTMLLARRGTAFAYSLAELPGYSGHMGPMRIKLKENYTGKLFSPPRRYSPLESDIIKAKTDELKSVGFIIRSPPNTSACRGGHCCIDPCGCEGGWPVAGDCWVAL